MPRAGSFSSAGGRSGRSGRRRPSPTTRARSDDVPGQPPLVSARRHRAAEGAAAGQLRPLAGQLPRPLGAGDGRCRLPRGGLRTPRMIRWTPARRLPATSPLWVCRTGGPDGADRAQSSVRPADAARLAGLMRAERPDIVLAYTMKPVIYGGLAARLLRVPRRFAMITGLGYVFGDRPSLARRLVRAVSCRLYRLALAGADASSSSTPMTRQSSCSARCCGPGQPAVRVDGSGVDTRPVRRGTVPDGPPAFLLAARLLRDKGIGEYVAAARLLRAPLAAGPVSAPWVARAASPASITPGRGRAMAGGGRDRVSRRRMGRAAVPARLHACWCCPPTTAKAFPAPCWRHGDRARRHHHRFAGMPRDRRRAGRTASSCRRETSRRWLGAMERFLVEPALAVAMGRSSREIALDALRRAQGQRGDADDTRNSEPMIAPERAATAGCAERPALDYRPGHRGSPDDARSAAGRTDRTRFRSSVLSLLPRDTLAARIADMSVPVASLDMASQPAGAEASEPARPARPKPGAATHPGLDVPWQPCRHVRPLVVRVGRFWCGRASLDQPARAMRRR